MGKPINHDRIIKDVYAEIYPDHYTFTVHELTHTKAMIQKNLDELGISQASLREITVLNVGTGIESVAFQELQVQNVYHFDISDNSVLNLKRLQRDNACYSNILSSQADMCSNDVIIPAKIGLVYLVGVLHHFYSPLQGMRNILPSVNVGGRLFLRIYRSGGMRAFVADYARKFIDEACRNKFKDVFCKRFKSFSYGGGVWQQSLPAHLYQIIYDDLFVPTLLFLHPRKVETFFEHSGCSVIQQQLFDEYDHECNSPGFGLISILLKKEFEKDSPFDFPSHVDQIDDIKYEHEHILSTIALMKAQLSTIKLLSDDKKIELAIELFWGALAYYLAISDKSIDIRYLKDIESSEGKHRYLQRVLSSI